MTGLTKEDRLLNVRNAEEQSISYFLNSLRYRRSSIALGATLVAIAEHSKTRGMVSYYLERDIAGLKQNFHVATRLLLAATGEEGGPSYDVGRELFVALLSDNPANIDAVARVDTPLLQRDSEDPKSSRFHVRLLQLSILGEENAMREKLDVMAKAGDKKDRDRYAQKKDFFSLLLNRDLHRLEDLICQHAKAKSQDPLIQGFMAFLATIEAKICWLKGIEVHIDSPFLPMELMPSKPLEHYDDVYDFLAPGYVPPKVGWLERVRYRFRERAQSKESLRKAVNASQGGTE